MAHFAKLNSNNIIENVLVLNNAELNGFEFPESEALGVVFFKNLLGEDTNWVQTSYNGRFRKNYAGIGFTYDAQRDAFIPPQPFASWVLNEDTCGWEAPTPMPTDNKKYSWNEEQLAWVEIPTI